MGGLGILGGVRRIVLDQLWQMFSRIAGVLLQVDILSIVGCPSSFRLLSGGGLLFVVWFALFFSFPTCVP